jgi:hypothetical protein
MISLPLAALSCAILIRARAAYGDGFARKAAILFFFAWLLFVAAVSAAVFSMNVSKL